VSSEARIDVAVGVGATQVRERHVLLALDAGFLVARLGRASIACRPEKCLSPANAARFTRTSPALLGSL
jgi:hypothetical protein